MVKASELRIRNWVNEPVLGNVLVDGVSPFVAYLKKKYDSFHYSINYENVFPIPLTHDILLKSNMEHSPPYSGNNGYYELNGFILHYDMEEDNDFFISYERTLKKVNTVHQLQNLIFALTNTEINIEI